jgi:hypothetical protein
MISLSDQLQEDLEDLRMNCGSDEGFHATMTRPAAYHLIKEEMSDDDEESLRELWKDILDCDGITYRGVNWIFVEEEMPSIGWGFKLGRK